MPWSPRHNQLRFAVERHDGRVIVRLAGELDCASAAIAHLALERAATDGTEIALDLSRVVFLDAAGLRFLISAQRRARAADRRMIVRRPSRSVRRLLDLTGVRPLLTIDETDNRRPDSTTPELTQILNAAIEHAMRIAHADRSTAQLVLSAIGAPRIVAQRGFNPISPDYLEVVNDIESLDGAMLRRGRPLWLPDLSRSSILADTPVLDMLLDAGVRAMASIPLKPDGELIAIISVYHRMPNEWSVEHRAELEQLGRSVAEQCLEALPLRSLSTDASAA